MAKRDILCLTKKQQVQAEIARIHFEHRYDAGAMFGTLTESEAKYTYEKLIGMLPEIPGLTEEERSELLGEINQRIANIPEVEKAKELYPDEYPDEREYGVQKDYLFKLKPDQVRDRMDQIHYEHRYDAGAMMGVLTATEAEHAYVKLMNLLYSIPDISEAESATLTEEIQARIEKIPEVEAEKTAEYLAGEAKSNGKQQSAKKHVFANIFKHKKS